MKRIYLLIILCLSIFAINAQVTAESILKGVASRYNSAKSISAHINISSAQGESSGNIIMQGKCFRLISDDIKSWFNGKTQWTYSKSSGEVNITTPTSEELQVSNPYSAITGLQSNYKSYLLKSSTKNEYALKFTPRIKDGEIKELHLNVNKNGLMVNKIILIMNNGASITTIITNYKIGNMVNNNTFIFNKKDVPARTPIVDLR